MSFPVPEKLSVIKVFGGQLIKYTIKSATLGGLRTTFNIYLPPTEYGTSVPVLWYLSGLTCTEDNAAQKGGFFSTASTEGIALIFPDTSPRGAGIEGEADDWDFGVAASFYLDATNQKFSRHYKMRTFITIELPKAVQATGLPIDLKRQSIFGHSMGGHGALVLYLSSNDRQYRSASAFAPIANPTKCEVGRKAFKGYLQGGVDEAKEQYDATDLIAKFKEPVHILVDYGTADQFYKDGQLLPENFLRAARESGYDESQVMVRCQDGYDHSYYFV